MKRKISRQAAWKKISRQDAKIAKPERIDSQVPEDSCLLPSWRPSWRSWRLGESLSSWCGILPLLLLAQVGLAELRPIQAGAGAATAAIDPASPEWKKAPAAVLTLHRTPPLYATDAPAALEIPTVQVQLLRGDGGAVIRLEWADKTREAAALAAAKKTWVGEEPVVQSKATDRFGDAVAVMLPARPVAEGLFPSLQMGDATHPVEIYFWDAGRGAVVMEAAGRGSTRRTKRSFPAKAQYAGGRWAVTMQLPALPPGTPISVAVWNGAQQDRDGRKYFTVWHKTE